MARPCDHNPTDLAPLHIASHGCADGLAGGRRDWVHLRLCQTCGHVGCCDNSPGKRATAHFHETAHPLVRSNEPGEDWWWCYVDGVGFHVEGAPPAPSHDGSR